MISSGLNISCYGCGVCAAACPKKAIAITISTEGFWVPQIDMGICVNCGICDKVCAYLDKKYSTPVDRLITVKAYAVVNKDEAIRKTSTSGGAGYAIATYMQHLGYTLVGVKYDNKKNIACHFATNDLEEFKQTLNSKYIPSYTVDGFSDLMKGGRYAVFGTPCQIDSLRRWAKISRKEHNFVFIDLFCHGVPSYLHWKAYLRHHLQEGECLENPIFRDKRNGWHFFTMSLQTNQRFISTSLQENDLFQNMFFGNYTLNQPCYHCVYRRYNSSADLRMGDLWGDKYSKNEEGITGVLALTEKGEELMKCLPQLCNIESEKYSVVVAGQMHHDLSVPASRKKILDGFRKKKYLPSLYFLYARRMWMKNLLPYKMKSLIKQLIYKLRNR